MSTELIGIVAIVLVLGAGVAAGLLIRRRTFGLTAETRQVIANGREVWARSHGWEFDPTPRTLPTDEVNQSLGWNRPIAYVNSVPGTAMGRTVWVWSRRRTSEPLSTRMESTLRRMADREVFSVTLTSPAPTIVHGVIQGVPPEVAQAVTARIRERLGPLSAALSKSGEPYVYADGGALRVYFADGTSPVEHDQRLSAVIGLAADLERSR